MVPHPISGPDRELQDCEKRCARVMEGLEPTPWYEYLVSVRTFGVINPMSRLGMCCPAELWNNLFSKHLFEKEERKKRKKGTKNSTFSCVAALFSASPVFNLQRRRDRNSVEGGVAAAGSRGPFREAANHRTQKHRTSPAIPVVFCPSSLAVGCAALELQVGYTRY